MERLTGPLIFTSPLSEPEDSLNGKHAMKELASDYFSQSSGENTIDRRGFLKCAVLAGSTGKGDHPHRDAVCSRRQRRPNLWRAESPGRFRKSPWTEQL
jgi:hypothetical protein